MGEKNSVKSAAVVFGALAAAWLAVELAFKPLLEKVRTALDKSDPDKDPDDAPEKSPVEADAGDDDADASKENT